MSLKFKWSTLALTLFILASFFQVISGIKCYDCDGPEGGLCQKKEDWKEVDFSKKNPNFDACFRQEIPSPKGVQIRLGGANSKERDFPGFKCAQDDANKAVYCYCNTDLCNSGGKVSVSSIIFGLSTLLLYISKF